MYDIEALRAKLEHIGYPRDSKLHEAFVSMAVILGHYDLKEHDQDSLLDLLSTEGRKDINKLPYTGEDAWEDFNYGNVRIGDFVRVKTDAFDSSTGKRHNGLVGILTFMSSGVCTVRYLGVSPERVVKHHMKFLDSLKLNVK